MMKNPAAAVQTRFRTCTLKKTRDNTDIPPNAHQQAKVQRLDPGRSAIWPHTSPPMNDIICISAPKPKLAENVSPRCIITVGIQPVRPKMQNRLRNADSQIASVVRRYLAVSNTAAGLPDGRGCAADRLAPAYNAARSG